MREFLILTNEEDVRAHPLCVGVVSSYKDDGKIYLVKGANLAAKLFNDFEYTSNKINDFVYWFENYSEINDIVISLLPHRDVKVLYDIVDDWVGDVYYICNGNMLYILNGGAVYHMDLGILSKLKSRKILLKNIIDDNFYSFDELAVQFKELGLIDDTYSKDNVIKALGVDYHYFLYMMEHVRLKHVPRSYNMQDKYGNPYDNIIRVEKYLNSRPVYNIDLDKCYEYGLNFGKLPARFNYSGFYTTTGRIYCTSDEWPPLQNLPVNKRDVLRASAGYYLIDIDYKSFEFDLLKQIIGEPIEDDPHTASFDKYVGFDIDNKRQIGKTINYAFIFGMNEDRLVDAIINEAGIVPANFRDDFKKRLKESSLYLKIKEFEKSLDFDEHTYSLTNYFGRVLHVKKSYAIVNNYIQSTAADFLYNKFLHITDIIGHDNQIILQNHDSILLHIKESNIEKTDMFEQILDIMRAPLGGLSGRIDYKYGLNWKEMS